MTKKEIKQAIEEATLLLMDMLELDDDRNDFINSYPIDYFGTDYYKTQKKYLNEIIGIARMIGDDANKYEYENITKKIVELEIEIMKLKRGIKKAKTENNKELEKELENRLQYAEMKLEQKKSEKKKLLEKGK